MFEKKMCFCEKQLSLNAENANAIDKQYNYVYIFIYLFFVKKELCIFGGKHTFEEKVQLTNEFEIR